MTGGDAASVPGACFRTADGLHLSPPAPTPAPRSDLYDDAWHDALNGRMIYVETSRGCPFQCAFCLSGSMEAPDGRTVQFMPAEEALALLIRLGSGGEGHTTFTIAGPTGEGITSAKSFTRLRRCVMADHFRII